MGPAGESLQVLVPVGARALGMGHGWCRNGPSELGWSWGRAPM